MERHQRHRTHDIAIRAAGNAAYSGKREPVDVRAARYLAENPEVYREFCRFAWEAVMAGRNRIGAKAIAERLRWESFVTGNDGFRCNNSYVSFMARRFMEENRQCAGLFKTRESKEG